MTFPFSKARFLTASLALLSACAVGPDYVKPPVDIPAAYKELPQEWKPATPRDDEARGEWWKIYNDPVLNALECQIDLSNQTLKIREASYRAALASVSETQASFFPTIALGGEAARTVSRRAPKQNDTTYNVTASTAWELDLWGRIRRTLESDEASAEASAADLASARLSIQASVATNYFSLRLQDELKKLLDQTVKGQERSLKIADDQYKAGLVSKADVMTAKTQLESTKSQTVAVSLARAKLEHALATLVGKTPSTFSIPPEALVLEPPTIPVDIPSTLLERRPDIAAAERRMAAANANVGVKTAAFFPTLTLSGSYGYKNTVVDNLVQASRNLWTFGPALAETIFDAGARSARLNIAEADYDQTVATYRQTVLTSFQDVEDQLASQYILADQAKAEAAVVRSAQEAERLVLNQYRAGVVPYSSVVSAQTTTAAHEQSALTVRQNRLLASVSLIKALGGGWDVKKRTSD